MKLNLEKLQNSLFEVKHSHLGLILGGMAPNTGAGSRVVGSRTPYETTISWSSDSVNYNSNGNETSGTWHQAGTEKDSPPSSHNPVT